MTVSSASYTTNSIKVTVSNETSPTALIAAVDTAITSLGWSQYDYIAPNSNTVITSASSETGTIIPTGGLYALTTFLSPTGTNTQNYANTYSNVTPYLTSGKGTGAVLIINKLTAAYSYGSGISVILYNSGTGYVVGDTITINGNVLGGQQGTNDLTLTIGGSVQTNNANGIAAFSRSGTAVSSTAVFNGVSQLSTSGSGYGAVFQVTRTASTSYDTSTIMLIAQGTGYAVGDIVTISGASVGGVLTTNNLVLTVSAIKTTNLQHTGKITGMVSTSAFIPGMQMVATAGTGVLYGGTPSSTVINSVLSTTSLLYTVNDGTAPTSGTITNILQQNLNTQNPMYTYVYRAICADNTNYKYLIIRWDPTKQQFFTAAAEGWNLTTRMPLNETYAFNGTFGHGYDLKDCLILVSATTSHFLIQPWIRNSMGLWSGIFEFERVAAEDTTANAMPNFAWTNSVILGYTSDNGSYPLVFPRLPNGASSTAMVPVNNRGRTTILGDTYNITYNWNTALSVVSSFSVDHNTYLQPVGRAYNSSVTKPFGAGLDTTTVPLAAGGWADTTGTPSTCLIMPLNGGIESVATSSLMNTNISGRPQSNGYSATGVVDMLLVGNYAWCACGTAGIKTYDTTTTGTLGTLTLRLSGNFDKLIFDGERTIYAIYVNAGTGGSTITRLDTETYSTATLTLPYAVHHLAIDGQNVYVAMSGNTTQPRVAIVSRWITSNGSTGAGFTLTNTYVPPVTTACYIANIFPDYRGNITIVYTFSSTYSRVIGTAVCGLDKVSITQIPTRAIFVASAAPLAVDGKANSSVGFHYDPISNFLVSLHGVMNRNEGWMFSNSGSGSSCYQLLYAYSAGSFTSTQLQAVVTNTAYWANGTASVNTANAITGVSYYGNWGDRNTNVATIQNVMPYRGNYLMIVELYQDDSISGTRYGSYLQFHASSKEIQAVPMTYTITSAIVAGKYSMSGTNYGIRTTYSNGTSVLKNIGGSIYYINNLYNMGNTSGAATGRLLLKG